MTKNLIPVSLIFLSIIIFFACQKDVNDLPPRNDNPVSWDSVGTPIDQLPDNRVHANLMGRITDEKGLTLKNVKVSTNADVVYTDEFGVFRLKNANVSEHFGTIKAEKEGYFPGIRTVLSNNVSGNFVEIQLNKRVLKGSVSQGSTSTIDINNGVSVLFNKNEFVNINGGIYSGTVNVFGTYLNPDDEVFSRIMPGDLRGISASNRVVGLQSYGMIGVELEGTNGEKLQLAEGSTVTLSANIPSSLIGSAPDSIPLWFFDETDGKWKEEGMAKKYGNVYKGEVKHFTYWNYDIPVDFVYASLKVMDKNNGIPYTKVKFIDTRNNTYGEGITDSTGYLKMWVPKNIPLEFYVYNSCKDVVVKKEVGPFDSDTEMGIISFSVMERRLFTLTGNVVNCQNIPVMNGVVNVFIDGLYYSANIIEGSYNVSVNRCNNLPVQARMIAMDHATNSESKILDVTINQGANNIEDILTCKASSEEYISIKIGNDNYSLKFPGDSLDYWRKNRETSFSVLADPLNSMHNGFLYLLLRDTVPYTDNISFSLTAKSQKWIMPDSLSLSVTQYGLPGEFIEADFSGVVMKADSIGKTEFMQGNLKIRRRY